MIAIMIPIKPYWFAKILNGEKNIEVRKNKALAKAIQKLIAKYGYAPILGYCTKDKTFAHFLDGVQVNGRVVACLYCDKVEEIIFGTTMSNELGFFTSSLYSFDLYKQSCLKKEEMRNYLKVKANGSSGYAIHISQLKIFDKPKELSEFKVRRNDCPFPCRICNVRYCQLKKAPQNFCYVEV